MSCLEPSTCSTWYNTYPGCLSSIHLMNNYRKPFGYLADREKPLLYARARALDRVFTRRVGSISYILDIRGLVRYGDSSLSKPPTHTFCRCLWQYCWSTPFPKFSTAIVQTRVAAWQVSVVHTEWASFLWRSIPSGEGISTSKSWQSGCLEATLYLNMFRLSLRDFRCSLKRWNQIWKESR